MRDNKAYRADPPPRRWTELRAHFDHIFNRQTGFATLNRLLERLCANKPGFLNLAKTCRKLRIAF